MPTATLIVTQVTCHKGSADFSITSAQHVYHDWVREQLKKDVKMMPVMEMEVDLD